MKPRHKALALAHAAAAPAEADAADLRAPGAAAFDSEGSAPFHFAAGASTSAAAGGAPSAAPSVKRVRKAVKAAAPTDEPSTEVKKRYKGVYWVSSVKKWVAQYALDGKNHHLGTFDASGQLEAALLWDAKQRELGRTGETRAVAGAPAPRESASVPRGMSRKPLSRFKQPQPQPKAPPMRTRAAPEPAPAMPAAKRARAAPVPDAAPTLVSPPPPPISGRFQEAAEEAAAQVVRILRGLDTPPAGARAVTEGTPAPQLLPLPLSGIRASPTFPWNAFASPPGRGATLRGGGVGGGNGTPLAWLEEGWPGMLLRPLAAGGSSASGSGGHSGSGSGSGSGSALPERSGGPARRGARAPTADDQSLWDLRPLFQLSALRGGRRASRAGSGGVDAGAPTAVAPDASAEQLAPRSTPRSGGGGQATRR